MTENFSIVTISTVMAIAIVTTFFLPNNPAIAGIKEDIARAEKEIELHKKARELSKRVRKRVREAVSQTAEAKNAIPHCEGINMTIYKRTLKQSFDNQTIRVHKTFEEYIWSECISKYWPFKDTADKLYKEFIGEEIDREVERLRDTMEEKKRKELKAKLRKLSI